MSVYDKKYLKTKVREYDGVIKTNFLGNDTPKELMAKLESGSDSE